MWEKVVRTWFHLIVFAVWIKQQSSYIIFQWTHLPIHHSPKKKKLPSVRNHRPGLDHGLNYDKNGPQMVGSKRKINRQLDFWYNLFKPKKKNCFYFPKLKYQMEIPFKKKPMCLVSPFFFSFFPKNYFYFYFLHVREKWPPFKNIKKDIIWKFNFGLLVAAF